MHQNFVLFSGLRFVAPGSRFESRLGAKSLRNEVKMATWDPLKIELKCVTVIIFTLWRVSGAGSFSGPPSGGVLGSVFKGNSAQKCARRVPGGTPKVTKKSYFSYMGPLVGT